MESSRGRMCKRGGIDSVRKKKLGRLFCLPKNFILNVKLLHPYLLDNSIILSNHTSAARAEAT